MKHLSFVLAMLVPQVAAVAQIPVPFVSVTERLMVFQGGRFHELDPRPPKSMHAMHGQVVYVDHEGALKMYEPEHERLHLLDPGPVSDVRATRQRVAWRVGDTLKTEREGRAITVLEHVERYEVSDSLIVCIDSATHQMDVLWKGQMVPLAEVLAGSQRPQWMQGRNTVALFMKEARKLLCFHRGRMMVLCDSTDVGVAAAGGDVVGYWDANAQRFMAMRRGRSEFLSDVRPLSAQAGDDLLAFVDGNGRLKCFHKGIMHTVLGEVPSGYWVKDSTLVYLDKGEFKLFSPQGSITVERYVPESWKVEGDLLVYLDINREVRGVLRGERIRFGQEANIAAFDLFGGYVVYRNDVGNTVVASPRRTWTY